MKDYTHKHLWSNMKRVLERAVKTRLLWLVPEGSRKDFLRHSFLEGQSKICHWK